MTTRKLTGTDKSGLSWTGTLETTKEKFDIYFDPSLPARVAVQSEIYPVPGSELCEGSIRIGYCKNVGEQVEALQGLPYPPVLGAWL